MSMHRRIRTTVIRAMLSAPIRVRSPFGNFVRVRTGRYVFDILGRYGHTGTPRVIVAARLNETWVASAYVPTVRAGLERLERLGEDY